MAENDLISRRALLDAMPRNDELFSFDVRKVICEAPSVEAEPKWISVKKKLPEENGYYLCWVEASSVGKRKEYEHRKLYWEENIWLSSAKNFKTEHPLYWMPLPEPPKEERHAD